MNSIEQIQQLMRKHNEAEAALIERFSTELVQVIGQELDKTQRIASIGWTQYAPYFNDGDACVFSAHVDDLYINDRHPDDDDEDDSEQLNWFDETVTERLETQEQVDAYKERIRNDPSKNETQREYAEKTRITDYRLVPNVNFDAEDGKVYENIRGLLNSVPEHFLQQIFGDDCKVTIYKGGTFSTEEYSHD